MAIEKAITCADATVSLAELFIGLLVKNTDGTSGLRTVLTYADPDQVQSCGGEILSPEETLRRAIVLQDNKPAIQLFIVETID